MAEFFPKRLYKILLNLSFIFLILCLIIELKSSKSGFPLSQPKVANKTLADDVGCKGIQRLHNKQEKCSYVKSQEECQPRGYIPYLHLFYCTFSPVLGYISHTIWLVLLFYLLGDTASNYFCSSLEGLSEIFNLSPTIAGITLLALGNGAPDVFACLISFAGGGSTTDIGLNSILGAGFFVSCFVVGIISICVRNHGRKISRPSFEKNVIFLMFCLSCVLVVVFVGRINLWGALAFLCLYVIYVIFVFTWERCMQEEMRITNTVVDRSSEAVLPIRIGYNKENEDGLRRDGSQLDLIQERPNFGDHQFLSIREGKEIVNSGDQSPSVIVPVLTRSSSKVNEDSIRSSDSPLLRSLGSRSSSSSGDQVALQEAIEHESMNIQWLDMFLDLLEMPLYLPRRLTIPVVSEDRWSKPFAVIAMTLAPFAWALTWDVKSTKSRFVVYAIGGSIGIAFGIFALFTTLRSIPPRKYLHLWLSVGFIMSITWTYILAQELISLLVSLGLIMGFKHSILGLTVLAWGNSLGDLVANVTMANTDGPGGAQVAFSGCYAGPIFNILVGLGMSLTFSCWKSYPASYVIHVDHYIFETVGFFIVGLVWALIVLPRRKMKFDRCLGFGLLAIYLIFLFFKIARSLGLVKLIIHQLPSQ